MTDRVTAEMLDAGTAAFLRYAKLRGWIEPSRERGVTDDDTNAIGHALEAAMPLSPLNRENERLAAYADGETDKLRTALRELDELETGIRALRWNATSGSDPGSPIIVERAGFDALRALLKEGR